MNKRLAAAILAAVAVPALALMPTGPAGAAAPAPVAAVGAAAAPPPPQACTYPPGARFQFTTTPARAKVRRNSTVRLGSTLKRNGFACHRKVVRYYVKPSGKRTYSYVGARRTNTAGKTLIKRKATKPFLFSARYYEGRRKVATSRTGRIVLKR